MSGALLLACLVIGVSDGDSMKVTCPARAAAFSVRLAQIDAPEIAHKAFGIGEQPGGRESKAALAALCLKQPAVVRITGYDRYRRVIAKVECNGVSVNAEQVRTGHAWAYLASKRSGVPALEVKARADGVGLWAVADPVRPSEWRKRR